MTSRQVFEKFVPPAAVSYCDGLYTQLNFEFKVKKGRLTKLGDYRFERGSKKETITINNDLNPYAFLVTYLHEVAHLATFRKHGRSVQPHGKEWKQAFVQLAEPLLNEKIFPEVVLKSVIRYFKNPKASSCSDPDLFKTLRLFDPPSNKKILNEINNQQEFLFHKKRFIRLEKKRTRWLCRETKTNRDYLILGIAEVELINDSE